ncbi:MAG: NYN domain-containing protein, partial [Marinibacterium sp.]
MTRETTERLAVLIDAENVPAKHAAGIFEEVATLGEASLRRAYGDFSKGAPQGWDAGKLAKHAIVPHQQFANTSKKN